MENQEIQNLLSPFPVIMEFPIAWGDMDAFSHVNNLTYIRHFESSRIAYFEKIEMLEYMELTGIGPILASVSCKFKAPLTYPDTVWIGASVIRIDEDRFTMHHRVVSQRLRKVAAEGEGVLVTYNYRKGVKVSVPDTIREKITLLQKDLDSHDI